MRNDYEQRADHDADLPRDDEQSSVIAPPRDGVPQPRTAADDEETRVFDTGDSTVNEPAGDLPGGTLAGRADIEQQAGWRPADTGPDSTAVGQVSVDEAMANSDAERAGQARDDNLAGDDDLSLRDADRADVARAGTAGDDDLGRSDTARDDTVQDDAGARTDVVDRVDTSDAIAAGDRGVDGRADDDGPAAEDRVAGDPDRSPVDERLTAADDGTFDSPANEAVLGAGDREDEAARDIDTGDSVAAVPVAAGAVAAGRTTADTTVTAPAAAPPAPVVTDGTDTTATGGQTSELLPGDAPAAPVAGLWADGQRDEYRNRWRDVQLKFVDDPKAAAEEAHALVNDAVEALTSSLNRQRDELSGWQGADKHDTEELRVALRRYRDFLDQITR